MLLLFAPPLSTPPLHISLHILSSPPLHLFSKNHLSASLCAPPLKPLTLSLLLLSELFLWMDGRTHTRGGIGERTERAEWEIKQAVPLWTLIALFSVPPLHFLSLNLPLQLSLHLHTDRDAEKVCRERVKKGDAELGAVRNRGVLYVKSACLYWLGNKNTFPGQ